MFFTLPAHSVYFLLWRRQQAIGRSFLALMIFRFGLAEMKQSTIITLPLLIRQCFSIQLNIFPNPASDKIQISNENTKGEFRIYNIHGKIMLTEKITEPNQTVDVRPLKSGIYIWQMENSKGKLLVQ